MYKEGVLDKILYHIRRFIPRSVFSFFQPAYHTLLAYVGATVYGFPSHSMKVIGVTGTKGKSTTVMMIAKVLEGAGYPVAAIGSLGYKIKFQEWPNNLKMTMPGRFKLQKFLAQAKKAGCQYVVLEVTSQGIAQKRHLGVEFDTAVFLNLHREHLESHGSFENYKAAKQELFKATHHQHVINADDSHMMDFANFPAEKKIFFGVQAGEMRAQHVVALADHLAFDVYGEHFEVPLGGEFNVYNCLATLSVGALYGLDVPTMRPILEQITTIPGRMEFLQKEPFIVVVDYAHTPDSLEAVYKTLSEQASSHGGRLIAVLGAAGGGRDTWKRPEFGKIAAKYCDRIILTDEDPFEESPEKILNDIVAGIPTIAQARVQRVMDRKEAIHAAIAHAKPHDVVIITGKGSETSMALAGGRKISWSDKAVVLESLQKDRI